jgi:polyisoprenoid-binding protein YceI
MVIQRFGAVLISLLAAAPAAGETRTIDPTSSSLTVHVSKSGVFSAFADNHEIRAPIAAGTADDGADARVEITVDAGRLTVLDPNLAPAKREEVQRRMLGPEVLDVARFAKIRFRSTKVAPLAEGRWRVEGVLELHGRSAPVAFDLTGTKERCRGSATLSQRAFGIEPISIAGGTVKVKDEVKIDFEIATHAKSER